jgi:hypothetical protein
MDVSACYFEQSRRRDLPIHSPDTSNDIHRQHNGTEDGKLAENVRRLLLALIHPDVDLGQVVAVSARKETAVD